MLALLRCTTEPGLRSSEVFAIFQDSTGRTHYLRVERDFLHETQDGFLMTVAVVGQSEDLWLVELDHEAETGANRVWVKKEQVQKDTQGVAA